MHREAHTARCSGLAVYAGVWLKAKETDQCHSMGLTFTTEIFNFSKITINWHEEACRKTTDQYGVMSAVISWRAAQGHIHASSTSLTSTANILRRSLEIPMR